MSVVWYLVCCMVWDWGLPLSNEGFLIASEVCRVLWGCADLLMWIWLSAESEVLVNMWEWSTCTPTCIQYCTPVCM